MNQGPALSPSAFGRWIGSPSGTALLVLLFSLLVTGALVASVAAGIDRQDRLAFDHEVDRTLEAINQRVTVTSNLVRGAAGLFDASEAVSQDEFRRYVETLQLRRRYPGILGIGYTRWLAPKEVGTFEAEVRATGRPDFRLWPAYPRADYSSILYLEPLDRRNAAAIGFDMATEPVRRTAMLAAARQNELVASGRVTLVQEIERRKQAGFLLYLPVRARAPSGVPGALQGFVYAPLRTGDLFGGTRGTGGERIDYELFDGVQATPDALLRTTLEPGEAPTGRYIVERRFEVAGRPWLLRVYSRPALDAVSRRWLVPWLMLAALAASALLARLSWWQTRARMQAEEAAVAEQEAARALHREREWLGATLNSIGDGVIAVDAADRVTWMNPVAERLTGWKRDAALGQPVETVIDLIDATVPHGSGSTRGAATLRGRDGSIRPIEHSRAPIRESEGYGSGAVVVMHDASERHRVEAELRANDRRKDEFLAMLAHELRNPLAPISTAAALLRLPRADAAHVQQASAVILRQVAHMTELVDDLLDVSRVTRGLVAIEHTVFDLREAVRAAVEQVHTLIERQRHTLAIDLDDAPLPVDGDRTRLTQVFANLLNNAAKYTPAGGSIRVEARRIGERIIVRVTDTGIGIGPELLPHIFELFTQAERTLDRSQGGLGIGLALVRSMVELHGGVVRAESAGPGQGSLFEVLLPAAERMPVTASAPDDAERSSGAPLRIVIVDDNDDAAQTLALLLESLGHTVRTFPTAERALEELDPATEVYILDIGLPGMSGYECARRLRADPRSTDATLFALSGYGQAADVAASADAGFALHLVKPVDAARLMHALADVGAGGVERRP